MSTRAHIRIINEDEKVMLYRHRDGYPKDLGISILKYLKRIKEWNVEKIKQKLLKNLKYYDVKDLRHRIEETCGMHGDEDYIYIIDAQNKTLKCYRHGLDVPFEKSCIPSNEVPIS